MFKVNRVEETVTRTFRIPITLIERLSTVAQNENVSVNKLIVQCCEYALDNLHQDNKKGGQ